ncbi:MAG: RnfABCDGE type electron transport complex subunit D, partial [Clostridia bacterium]|nr:RnfABCDGE type electron transport complex subunit D [Clostridia bacterium]
WISAIGSVVAIIVVKQMFGGLGFNFANSAIAARIVLLVSFPSFMTRYIEPISHTVTSATPLASESAPTLKTLFLGMHSGVIGETSAFLLIIGGIYLILRGVITPYIPVCFVGTVALLSLAFGEDISLQVFGGGLMLGAVFMATDYVTSPVSRKGKIIFGIGCGLLTFVIRRFAALPEGVSYAILIMNILTPHINRLTLHKPFGMEGKQDE